MKKFLRTTILSAISLWILGEVLGSVSFSGGGGILLTAVVLGILNATVKPVLKVLALPVTLLTFGLFSVVINAAVLYLAFQISGEGLLSFTAAIPAALVLTVINGMMDSIFQ